MKYIRIDLHVIDKNLSALIELSTNYRGKFCKLYSHLHLTAHSAIRSSVAGPSLRISQRSFPALFLPTWTMYVRSAQCVTMYVRSAQCAAGHRQQAVGMGDMMVGEEAELGGRGGGSGTPK